MPSRTRSSRLDSSATRPRTGAQVWTEEDEEYLRKLNSGLPSSSAPSSFNREEAAQSLFGREGPVARFGRATLDAALDVELPLEDFGDTGEFYDPVTQRWTDKFGLQRGNRIKIREIPEIIGNAADELGSIFTGEAIEEGAGMLTDIYRAARDPDVPPGTIPKAMALGAVEGAKDMALEGIGQFKESPFMTATGAGLGPKMAKAAIKGAGDAVRAGGKRMMAHEAGVPVELLGDISEQRSLGPNAKFSEFERGMRMTPEELTQDVQQKVGIDLPEASRKKHLEGMKRLRVPEGGLDPLGMLVDAGRKLEKHRIRIGRDGKFDYSKSRISRDTQAQKQMNDMIETINEGVHSQDPREIAESLSIAYDMIENIPLRKKRVRQYMRDVWHDYRDAVGQQIPGYLSLIHISEPTRPY